MVEEEEEEETQGEGEEGKGDEEEEKRGRSQRRRRRVWRRWRRLVITILVLDELLLGGKRDCQTGRRR